jgi:hypothetical protein
MIRAILFLTLLSVAGLVSCSGSFRYTSYEVIHSPKYLNEGDQVRVLAAGEVGVTGTVLGVNGGELKIVVDGEGERNYKWKQIKVIERVEKTKVRK